MAALSQYQVRALNCAINHLDPRLPRFSGSDAIRAALSDPAVRNYLQSWVLPLLCDLRDGDMPDWQRESLSRDPAAYDSKLPARPTNCNQCQAWGHRCDYNGERCSVLS